MYKKSIKCIKNSISLNGGIMAIYNKHYCIQNRRNIRQQSLLFKYEDIKNRKNVQRCSSSTHNDYKTKFDNLVHQIQGKQAEKIKNEFKSNHKKETITSITTQEEHQQNKLNSENLDLIKENKEMLINQMNEIGIEEIDMNNHDDQSILCPYCKGGSTRAKSFSVKIAEDYTHALFHCFRAKCGNKGVLGCNKDVEAKIITNRYVEDRRPHAKPNINELRPLDKNCMKFFTDRMITKEVVERNYIMMKQKNENGTFIAFPYIKNGEIVNIKFRNLEKKSFSQVKNAEKIFFGYDDVKGENEIIIVEGEMDKLALEVAGYKNVISVPDGAPNEVKAGGIPMESEDKRFSYIWNCKDIIENATRVILATDNDKPGEALAEELSRRIGLWKCWKVTWPINYKSTVAINVKDGIDENNDELWFRKDANEVLMKDGIEVLASYIKDCDHYPVVGIYKFLDFYDEIMSKYMQHPRLSTGYSTGWPGLDKYYKIVPGELTVVSGVPNSGKSEWLDALAVNLAELYDWNIAFCSMEKVAWDHARQLIEKYMKKPFFQGLNYSGNVKKMTQKELQDGLFWINSKFPLILDTDQQMPKIDWILGAARLLVLRYGIRGLIIDPYNELNHARTQNMTETEFVNEMLSKIKRFGKAYGVHVWIVAHPRQLHDWKGGPPNLYDISGSAHFINKADAGIVIHRNWQLYENKDNQQHSDDDIRDCELREEEQYLVNIMVRKMRNKAAGTVGEYVLKYDQVTGRYKDLS